MNSMNGRRFIKHSFPRMSSRVRTVNANFRCRSLLTPNRTLFTVSSRSASTNSNSPSLLMSKFMQPVSATSQTSVEEFDEAIWQYVSLAGDPITLLANATHRDPTMVMGYILSAALQLLSTGLTQNSASIQLLRGKIHAVVREGKITDRERIAAAAIEFLSTGHWQLAAEIIDNQLMRSPTDLLFIRLSHDIHFFLGETDQMLRALDRVFQYWDPTMPGYGRVCGMLSFALCETGQYDRAEELAMSALHQDNMDVWAAHGAVHVYEMMGRREEGLRLLKELEDNWIQANMFNKHMAWHKSLLQLEEGTNGYRSSLSNFDDIFADLIEHAPPSLADYSSLLLRLQLLHNPVQQVRGTYELDATGDEKNSNVVTNEQQAGANTNSAQWTLRTAVVDETSHGYIQGTDQTYPSGRILPDLPAFIRPPTGDAVPFPVPAMSIQRHKGCSSDLPCPFDAELPQHLKNMHQYPTRWEFMASAWFPFLHTTPGVDVSNNPRVAEPIHVYNDVHAVMALAFAAKSGSPSPAGATWQASDLEDFEKTTEKGLFGGDWREITEAERETGAPVTFVHAKPVTFLDHAQNLLLQMRHSALLTLYPDLFPSVTEENRPVPQDLAHVCAQVDATLGFPNDTVQSYLLAPSFPLSASAFSAEVTSTPPLFPSPSPFLQRMFPPTHPFARMRSVDAHVTNAITGCDLAYAVYAFSRQRYIDSARYLTRSLPNIQKMGGSKPQREIFHLLYIHTILGAIQEHQHHTQLVIDEVMKAHVEEMNTHTRNQGISSETKVTVVPQKPNVYTPTTIPVTPETLRIMSSYYKTIDQYVACIRSVLGEFVMQKSQSTLTWYTFGAVNEHIAQWMEGKEQWDAWKRPVLSLLREEARENKAYAKEILKDFPDDLLEESSVHSAKKRVEEQVDQYDRLLQQAKDDSGDAVFAAKPVKKGLFQRLFGSTPGDAHFTDGKNRMEGSEHHDVAGIARLGQDGRMYAPVTPFSSYNGVQSLRGKGSDGKNRAYLLGLNHGPGY